MTKVSWFLLIFIIAIFVDIWVMGIWRRYRQQKQNNTKMGVEISRREIWNHVMKPERLNTFSITFLQQILDSERIKQGFRIVLELILIAIWALYLGRDYLDMDQRVIPAGREFSSSIQAHHLWTRFQECGWCAVWDGSERGGFPAFADPLASALHPAMAITTLAFGVVNGAKLMVIISLWIAGLAQWWLGRVLKLSWLPRMWGAAMVMVGGHLAGRMELGIVSLLLSSASVSLAFAPAIQLAKTGSKRDTVVLAVVLALMAVSGQGYMQVGFIFMVPAYLILILRSDVGAQLLWKRFFTAAGLAFLLAAPFLVPFLHFWPNFLKDSDPYFQAGQPLSYYLLNLFIDNRDFFYNTTLEKLPYPNMYTMFVGWIPVGMAVVSFWLVRKKDQRVLLFLAVCGAMVLFFGSTQPLQWLQPIFSWVSALRYITMIGGLAVPAIIALAAYTLDKLLRLNWPRLTLSFSGETKSRYLGFDLDLLLLIPLIMAVWAGYNFSQLWLYTERMGDGVFQMVEGLQTTDLQWVNPPFGEHPYIEPAVRMGLKLSPGIMTWRWEGREFPIAVLEANRSGPPAGPVQQIAEVDGVPIYSRLDQPYAAVLHGDAMEPCIATGSGGKLDVLCNSAFSGKLIVKENTWTGWKAWMDGERVPLNGEQWLEVDASMGEHTYQFRYRPWDVPLGIALSLVGALMCAYLWFGTQQRTPVPEPDS